MRDFITIVFLFSVLVALFASFIDDPLDFLFKTFLEILSALIQGGAVALFS